MRLVFLILVILIVTACGDSGTSTQPLEERILGKWSGALTNVNGDKIPATWEFLEGGAMVVKIVGLDVSYGGKWSVEGDRINFTTELDPEKPNYRDTEFVSEDIMKLTKEGIEETWSRVEG